MIIDKARGKADGSFLFKKQGVEKREGPHILMTDDNLEKALKWRQMAFFSWRPVWSS